MQTLHKAPENEGKEPDRISPLVLALLISFRKGAASPPQRAHGAELATEHPQHLTGLTGHSKNLTFSWIHHCIVQQGGHAPSYTCKTQKHPSEEIWRSAELSSKPMGAPSNTTGFQYGKTQPGQLDRGQDLQASPGSTPFAAPSNNSHGFAYARRHRLNSACTRLRSEQHLELAQCIYN